MSAVRLAIAMADVARPWRVLALVLALLAVCAQPVLAQSSNFGSTGSSPNSDDDDNDGELFLLLILLGGIVGTAPLWGPPIILDDDYTVPASFYEHPYALHQDSYLSIGKEAQPGTTVWGATLSTEYGYESQVDRFGTRLTIDTLSRFGIDTEWNQLHGTIPNRPWDDMQTGDFHFTARFAQHSNVQCRVGLGMRWLDDPLDTNYGFSSLYNIEVQPVRPLSMSVNLESGTLRHEWFFHGRATVGVIWSHLEMFTGFDYLQIDEQEIAGPLLGLRLWL